MTDVKKRPQERPVPTRAPTRATGLLRFAPPVLSLLYALAVLPPWSPRAVGAELDDSWRWIMHEAWSDGLSWGREIIFTAGPYGFLLTETYHPETFRLMLAIYAGLSILLVAALWRILGRGGGSSWLTLLLVLGFIELTELWDVSQSLFYHLGIALVWLTWEVDRGAEERTSARESGGARCPTTLLVHVLVATLAFASLVKVAYIGVAAVIVGAVACDELYFRRRAPWPLLTFAGSWMLGWSFAGQPWSGLGSYLTTSFEISSGFNAAMGLPGRPVEVLVYLPAVLFVVGSFARMQWLGRRWRAVLPIGVYAVLWFAIFKVAFVRHDAHALTPTPLLVPWSLVMVAQTVRLRQAALVKVLALCALLSSVAYAELTLHGYRRTGEVALIADHVASWPSRLSAIGDALNENESRRRYDDKIAEIRREAPLPHLEGAVDLYASWQGVVLAHDLDYRPRPVIQSYSAYTPALSEINAAHLRGPRAPDKILFTIAPINQRLPSLDDSLSWPELLTRYETGRKVGRFLLLSRLARPRARRTALIGETRGRLGEALPLPDDTRHRVVWAEMTLRPTIRGRLAGLAFKPPAVWMALKVRSGGVLAYRIIPALTESGFLLSPLIADSEDFAALATRDGRRPLDLQEVQSITIFGDRGSSLDWALQPDFELSLWSLDIERGARRDERETPGPGDKIDD